MVRLICHAPFDHATQALTESYAHNLLTNISIIEAALSNYANNLLYSVATLFSSKPNFFHSHSFPRSLVFCLSEDANKTSNNTIDT